MDEEQRAEAKKASNKGILDISHNNFNTFFTSPEKSNEKSAKRFAHKWEEIIAQAWEDTNAGQGRQSGVGLGRDW